ncbi:MAG: diguanylate cyclase [Phycisphaerales bacterium]|nr:diguanylate cyclase [Phycisphaerales bacterium]
MPIKTSRTLGIRRALLLSIALTAASTILGGSALFGYKLRNLGSSAEILRARTFAETYAAQIAPLVQDRSRAGLQDYMEALVPHPSVFVLLVLDPAGQTVVSRGHQLRLATYHRINPAQRTEASWILAAGEEQGWPRLAMVAVDLRPYGSDVSHGTLVCAVTLSGLWQTSREEIGGYFAWLLALAGFGVLIGFWYLRRTVLIPLKLLAKHSRTLLHSRTAMALPTDRADEIGELARVLSEMYSNLDQLHERAEDLEKTVTDRVAAKTRQITKLLRQTEKKAWTDPLTCLGNRQLFEDKFPEIFRAQKEAGQDLAIVMMDLDHFKTLNDTLGHQAGDDLLRFVGELLRQCIREQDLAIRYGGDEFLMILPGVSAKEAATIAERTIRLFAQKGKTLQVPVKPTISAGVASLVAHRPATQASLFEIADQALYEAKNAGKSMVLIAPPQQNVLAGLRAV